jgi:AAA+ superfamily predicted ATPase
MNITNFLKTTSLEKNQINDLKFFHEYLCGKHSAILSSKVMALTGEAGIGKTHIAKLFCQSLELPVLYVGQEKLKGKNIKKYSSVRKLVDEKLPNNCLVFIDDLNYLTEEGEFGEVSTDFKRLLLKLIAKIKEVPRAGLLITANFIDFDSQLVDRINIIIELDAPNKNNKKDFLKTKYNEFVTIKQINQIATDSIGFNFRDLNEVIKKSYRYGAGNFTHESIKSALKAHEPTNYRQYDIHKNIELKFNDIIGRDKIKNKLNEIILVHKNKNYVEKYGLKRTNLIIFHGDPGLGKTFMAKAVAGEIGFPLVNMNSTSIYNRMGPLVAFDEISRFSKRFRDAVIFIDEADKLIGRGHFDSDGPVQGMLNEIFDGVKGIKNSLIILAMNNISSFGNAMKDRFTLIEFDYPNIDERKMFFDLKIKKHKNIFQKVDTRQLAFKTEKLSFRDVERIWNQVIFNHISTKNKVGMIEFNNALLPYKKENNMVFG